MPKRKSEEPEEERWQRKMKKYEAKLHKKRKGRVNRVYYSSDEEQCITQEHLEPEPPSPVQPAAGHAEEYVVDVHNDAGLTASDDGGMELQQHDVVGTAAAETSSPAADAVNTNIESLTTHDHAVSTLADAGSASAMATSSPATDSFDPELLRALGEFETDTDEWAENIHDDVAKHFQHILVNGLKKELKDDLNKKYLFAKNLSYSKAPTLNPEIAAMLTEACRNRDKRILAKQEQIGKALSALGKAMTLLLKRESNISEAIRTLNDVGKLMADAHFAETDTRRSVIIPLVEKSLIDPFKDRKRDRFLFGEKLGDLVKDSRGISKTGQLIQAHSTAATSSSTLNWRGPPPRPRVPRGGHPRTGRGGGPRAAHLVRRPPPPAPPARRPPPPPPPPPRRQAAQPRSSNYQRQT